jgi:hypothetical protein
MKKYETMFRHTFFSMFISLATSPNAGFNFWQCGHPVLFCLTLKTISVVKDYILDIAK